MRSNVKPPTKHENTSSSLDAKAHHLNMMNERLMQLEGEIRERKARSSPVERYSEKFGSSSTLSADFIPEAGEIDHTVDFYHTLFESSVKLTQGPLSWVSVLSKDIYLNAIVVSSRKKVVLDQAHHQPNKTEVEKEFLKRWQIEDVDTCDVYGDSVLLAKKKDKDVLTLIKAYLKDVKLVWLLVDKFFNSEFYGVMPIVDKGDFVRSLSEIIGPRTETSIKIKLTKKNQLCTLGILLLIMRMGSLTMYNFGKKPYCRGDKMSEDDQYIIDHPISNDIMHLISKCHYELKTFREPRLEIFQFLSLRVYFRSLSPEDCDCVVFADSGSVGNLLHYAVKCGLNIDPTSSAISPVTNSNKNKNLLRRLWYRMVYLDSHQLMLVGSPPIIDSKFYDTHFPYLDESTDEFDHGINVWFYERAKLYEVCYPLLMLILNLREKPKISQIKKLCLPVVSFMKTLDSIEEIMQRPSDTLIQRSKKFQDITFLIDCYSLLFMVYYHLFIFFNERRDKEQSLHYLLEALKISTSLYPLSLFLEPQDSQFDLQKHFGCGVLLFPRIELVLHRVSQILFAIIARFKSLKYFKPGLSPEIITLVDKMWGICTDICTVIISRYVKISDTYYHPWVTSKMHAFILTSQLHMPKGKFDPSTLEEIDVPFFETIKSSKHYDSMFESFELEDFIQINEEIVKFERIENESTKSNSPDLSQWNSQLISDNDKRWIEQMLDGTFDVTDQSSIKTESSGTVPQEATSFPTLNTYDTNKSPVMLSKEQSNLSATPDGLIPSQADPSSMNDLINWNVDWKDIDRLLYNWSHTDI
jgi:glycosyltransferase involved in cell wall biosynthesis